MKTATLNPISKFQIFINNFTKLLEDLITTDSRYEIKNDDINVWKELETKGLVSIDCSYSIRFTKKGERNLIKSVKSYVKRNKLAS